LNSQISAPFVFTANLLSLDGPNFVRTCATE
jgi:hypothetical protein